MTTTTVYVTIYEPDQAPRHLSHVSRHTVAGIYRTCQQELGRCTGTGIDHNGAVTWQFQRGATKARVRLTGDCVAVRVGYRTTVINP